MKYRVTMAIGGWRKYHFDFERGKTVCDAPDREALHFMEQATRSFVPDPEEKDKEFRVTLEVIDDGEEEVF